MINNTKSISRRRIIRSAAIVTAVAFGASRITKAMKTKNSDRVVDRTWLFGVPTNADNYWTQRSVMTPAEGATYLGVPNVIMVDIMPHHAGEKPFQPFESPLEQYTVALRPFKRVLWSLTGASGWSTPEYRKEAMHLAMTTDNVVGLYMDDFFFQKPRRDGRRAALTLDELKSVRDDVKNSGKKLDIWVTYYTSLLTQDLNDYLSLIDGLTIWTGRVEDLDQLETNMARIEKLGPRLRKTLGCYFFDYHDRRSLTVKEMQYQCELGLKWLRQGRIEGIVFLDNHMEDQNFESVEWTRKWIQGVGHMRL